MKWRIISVVSGIAFIIGLSLLLYPTVSNYFHTVKHRRAISNYLAAVDTLSDENYSEILNAARAYNRSLAENQPQLMALTDEQKKEYESLLDITGTGIMGYISIRKADIELPIYHGTREAVLQAGVGHVEGSSLPIGGESVHSMISGHRGLPSAKLFTNLDKLEPGDTFTIRVLNEIYTYAVDEIKVVEPDEVRRLEIEQNKDYCTLITCTPYGINTHRLLVRGKRALLPELEEKMAIQAGTRPVSIWLIIAIAEVPSITITVMLSVRQRPRKRTSQR